MDPPVITVEENEIAMEVEVPMNLEIAETPETEEASDEIEIIENYDERSRSPIISNRSQVNCVAEDNVTSQENTSEKETIENNDSKPCSCSQSTAKKRTSSDNDDEEGKLCPICFDIWSNSGEHRLCALRCGHLFGHSCLQRWLSTQKSCPTCKTTVRKPDIRFIYAKRLIALDTSELDAVRLELDREKGDRNRIQIELIQCKQREDLQKKQICDLKLQIEQLRNTSKNISNNASVTSYHHVYKFYREKSLEICRDGGCRVMEYYKNSNLLVVSSQSPNPIFGGFGIRKVSFDRDFRSTIFIPLHSNTIRDLAFHNEKELLLSVSIDKSAKLTETSSNKPVLTVPCNGPLWSCCWDTTNSNCFFLGEQSGSVIKYDLRKPNEQLNVLQIAGDFSPVVSVQSAGWHPGGALPNGGVIVCKLNSCSVFVENADSQGSKLHPLNLDGPFVSMRYDAITEHLLVTARSNSRHQFARHSLCTFAKRTISTGDVIQCDLVHMFQGAPVQKLLSRSCQINLAGDVLVAAHQESKKTVEIYSVVNGYKCHSIPAHNLVYDLCPIIAGNTPYLCSLSEKKVDFYKIDVS